MDELVLKMARRSASRVHHLIRLEKVDSVPRLEPALCGATPGPFEKWWPIGTRTKICSDCSAKANELLD